MTACGTTETDTASNEGGNEGYSVDEIKINIWDNNQKDGLQEIADDWTAKSGVKVSIEVVDWDNYWTLLEAGASGGEMPDVNGNGSCDDGERYSAYNGLGWAANANVADPKACYDLVAYFCSEEGSLLFRPYTRNTTVWEDGIQRAGGFLDAWQNPEDARVMEKACENSQKIIEDAIAAE